MRTNTSTAEMIKYSSNSVLALLISFSNELAALSTALGDVDAAEVMDALHQSQYFSPRIETGRVVRAPITSFLMPGCGFGGSCLPKDVAALVAHGQARGVPMRLLSDILTVNKEQADRTVGLVVDNLGRPLQGSTVAVLGLAFKQDTDDVRETPALPIVRKLLDGGASVVAHDPIATDTFRRLLSDDELGRVRFAPSMPEAVDGADAIVVVTRWDEYRGLADELARTGAEPLVVDGRRLLDPGAFTRYAAIGR